MCIGEECREEGMAQQGDSPLTSRSSCVSSTPVELPDGSESSSLGEFNFSFGAREEDEVSAATDFHNLNKLPVR